MASVTRGSLLIRSTLRTDTSSLGDGALRSSGSAAAVCRSRCDGPARHRRRSAARSARGRGAHPLLLPAPAARGVARPAARTLPAFPTPPLTPRLARWSSLSQAVSPSVRALVAPEVLTANRRLHRRLSFTRPLTLPQLTRTCCRCVRLQGAVENDLRSGFISFPGWLAVRSRKNVPENVPATARTRPKTPQRHPPSKK